MSESIVTVFICVSCRRRLGDGDEAFDQPGRGLASALRQRLQEMSAPDVAVAEVDCLAVCTRPCTLALAAANKWTYLIGDLEPEAHVDEIVAAVKSFAASENGIIAWRERPPSFRKGVVARVPPRPSCLEPVEQ
jgi:predicted metal-binding protein